jgi:GalNAc-alpha-(1->4)-GalNAc-alpha-(1->3)-diNAcBac-PP-undecaprenol alpha-1,4-N-acetyl-D-galactosaminyltransferase
MTKILFLTNSLTGGGAERAMNIVANELVRLGFEVGLVPINESKDDFVKLNCPVFPLLRKWQGGLTDTMQALIRYGKVLKKFDPDIVVLTCELPELFAALHFHRSQSIVVEEAKDPWRRRKILGQIVRRWLFARNVRWVAASGHLDIWPGNRKPDCIIPNPLTDFGEVLTSTHIDLKQNSHTLHRLAFVGRLSPEKRPDWFFEICNQSQEKGVCFGAGLMEAYLREYTEKHSIEVQFMGFTPNPWQSLDSNDLVIIPSQSEGDGLVVIEAISRGLPILLSDIPEFRFFGLDDKHYCKESKDFTSRILTFSRNIGELRVREDKSRSILESRKIEKVGQNWVQLISEARAS